MYGVIFLGRQGVGAVGGVAGGAAPSFAISNRETIDHIVALAMENMLETHGDHRPSARAKRAARARARALPAQHGLAPVHVPARPHAAVSGVQIADSPLHAEQAFAGHLHGLAAARVFSGPPDGAGAW